MTVRVIALGSAMRSDDGAALRAAERLRSDEGVEVIEAGRAGLDLVSLLDPTVPTIVFDVVRQGAAPGAIVELPLAALPGAAIAGAASSSHGLGVAHALRLAASLGRALPRGVFLGIGGRCFALGTETSPEVEPAIAELVSRARRVIQTLRASDDA